jgi:hypothetical protein
MITPSQALLLLETLAGCLRPPDGYTRPAMPDEGLPPGRSLTARVFAEAFNRAGIDLPEATRAVQAYLDEPDPGTYPKPWPDPGKLIARTARGRAMVYLGSKTDGEAAFEHFRARMRALVGEPDRDTPRRHLDPADPYRNDAMFAALDKVGGASRWCGLDLSHPLALKETREQWIAAYTEARAVSRADQDAVRFTARLTTRAPQPLIAEAK